MNSLNLVLLALLPLAWTFSVKDFKPALFSSSKPSGFYNIDTGSPNSGEVLALVDLNGDKYTDYIATQNRSSPILQVYYWDIEGSVFSAHTLTLSPPSDSSLEEVMACDINADGLYELVVTYSSNSTYFSQVYQTQCQPSAQTDSTFASSTDSTFASSTCSLSLWNIDYSLLSDMEALPFIFDRFSNGSVSLFTFLNGERTIVTALPRTSSLYSQPWGDLVTNLPSSLQPPSQHFASMIDVNGDCFSDVVLLSGNLLEMYSKNNHNKYDYSSITINKTISWLSLADLDNNGANDLFLVALQNGSHLPYALLNANRPEDICQQFESPAFSADKLTAISLPSGYKLVADSNIKIGDFNYDGYPDLLGIFSLNSYRTVTVLANRPGLKFQELDADMEPLSQITNPLQTCLYDFAQSGKLSVLIISEAAMDNGSTGKPRTSIINNLIEDTLFIKVLPLLPSSSSDFDSTALANAVGVTIEWRLTNLDGDKTISSVSQKSQWNYGSLQLPFATYGLGRTNNYIEDLRVSYAGFGVSNSWTPVIPNSQLMVLPESEGLWMLETLLKDNSRVYQMIYISILCLLGMGVLILFLNWRENQEDKRDHYNFIQMIR